MSLLKSIEVDGIKLNYEERGSGQPVIFIHGIPTDYRAWSAQMDEFSKSFHTIAYSRRCSFPNAGKDFENSTIENNAKDLEGLVSKITSRPVDLVGHSYGGFIAMFCAFRQPELVKNLVLIEPFIPTLLIKNLNSSLDQLSLLLRMPSVALAARKLLNGSFYPALKELDKGNGENALRIFVNGLQQRENAFDQFPDPVKSMMRDNENTVREAMTKLPDFTKKEAASVTQPTLLISGTNTSKALSKITDVLSKVMIKSQLVNVNNSAHFPHFENPVDCNSRIMEFLSKQK